MTSQVVAVGEDVVAEAVGVAVVSSSAMLRR